MVSSAHNVSVGSSDQFILRFFLGERKRRVSSVAIFVTTTHASGQKGPETALESFYTSEFFGTMPLLHVPRLPHGGSLGTPKILGTSAKLHLGPIRLHVENWE